MTDWEAPNASSPAEALDDLLSILRSDALLHDLPNPSVSVIRVVPRNLAIGNLRGLEKRTTPTWRALKGGRLEATVRFLFEDGDAGVVEDAVQSLHGRILAARNDLWRMGVLKIETETTASVHEAPSDGAWRQTADYLVLYEYRYREVDSLSLIARIPVHVDGEYDQSFVVTDEMVRWDNEQAPALRAQGPLTVRGLSALAYLPDAPSGTVLVSRTRSDDPAPPTSYPNWDAFRAAVTDVDAPDRHAQVSLPSIADLLAAMDAGDGVELGDWEEDDVPDAYTSHSLILSPPIQLGRGEVFRITYSAAALDAVGVVYIRAARRIDG